jgi:hypothetical protein
VNFLKVTKKLHKVLFLTDNDIFWGISPYLNLGTRDVYPNFT